MYVELSLQIKGFRKKACFDNLNILKSLIFKSFVTVKLIFINTIKIATIHRSLNPYFEIFINYNSTLTITKSFN